MERLSEAEIEFIARCLKEGEPLPDSYRYIIYNGEVFNFDNVFYAEDLKKQDYEVRFNSTKLDGQMMLIYIDIFGNEKREVKRLKDLRKIR